MHRYILYPIAGILLFTSCSQPPAPVTNNKTITAPPPAADTLPAPVTDTLPLLNKTIRLSGITASRYKGPDLNDSIAASVLYRYFEKKGYYTEDKLPPLETLSEKDANRLCAAYDTIYKVDINHNQYADAVISYWLAPPYASSHCFQPDHAIIIDADKGYKITNEAFIPDNYSVDTVLRENGQLVLYGYDYSCAEHKDRSRLRIKLVP